MYFVIYSDNVSNLELYSSCVKRHKSRKIIVLNPSYQIFFSLFFAYHDI
jgi:hypothetical protein